jgi:hypothetical protein
MFAIPERITMTHVTGNSKLLPVKSPELVSVFIEASRSLKGVFLDN